MVGLSCNTLSVPSCHATQRKHEGSDTARFPQPSAPTQNGVLNGLVRCCKKWRLIDVSGVRAVNFFPDCLIERLEV
ncbi:hypothetical protein T265_06243 [Opisthorchis viverrini]|uniref:Uncharacterized protein n=1 Tax=Opisthorchis viverrini TaxID=6198 RepID=A0A074ZH36_OPIVI|nr:hypothetical protein T265_06243 [Opisthorchis viverrini]KER26523.1 hypothetical protein T265_06243 [Opisthorchis viverrini]